jgi:putative RNA 2'-phosphotransferase
MPNQHKNISKLLSLVLRHRPETIDITLDENGWASVPELIQKINHKGIPLDEWLLQQIVADNDKQRFAFNEDKTLIRANQGHSIDVELQLEAKMPPPFLFHGTVVTFVAAIRKEGLQKMSRQHVHLSADRDTATRVGARRGTPVILVVRAGDMHAQGFVFYQSANGVWLTHTVPQQFIEFSDTLQAGLGPF